MPPDSDLPAQRICSLECLGFSSNSASWPHNLFLKFIFLWLSYLYPWRYPLGHPGCKTRILHTQPDLKSCWLFLQQLLNLSVLFLPQSIYNCNCFPWRWYSQPPYWIPYILLQATPHFILHASTQIKFNFQWVFCLLISLRGFSKSSPSRLSSGKAFEEALALWLQPYLCCSRPGSLLISHLQNSTAVLTFATTQNNILFFSRVGLRV